MMEKLPNRRNSVTLKFYCDQVKYHATVTLDDKGVPLEVFFDAGKVGSAAHIAAKDLAVVTSIALRYGTPIDVIAEALSQERDGTPIGPLGILLKELRDMQREAS